MDKKEKAFAAEFGVITSFVDKEEAMDPSQIVKFLSETRNLRATIYLNEKRVREFYDQCSGAITQLLTSDELNSEVTGGIQAFIASLGSKVSGKESLATQITISPVLMAILLEYHKKQIDRLLNPHTDDLHQEALFRYAGDSRIILPEEEATAQTTGWPDALAKIVQDERVRQESIMKHAEENVKTIVWVASGKRYLASVVSAKWVDFGTLCSYPKPPYGLLGRVEQEINDVVFISPLWIWHEGS